MTNLVTCVFLWKCPRFLRSTLRCRGTTSCLYSFRRNFSHSSSKCNDYSGGGFAVSRITLLSIGTYSPSLASLIVCNDVWVVVLSRSPGVKVRISGSKVRTELPGPGVWVKVWFGRGCRGRRSQRRCLGPKSGWSRGLVVITEVWGPTEYTKVRDPVGNVGGTKVRPDITES